MSDVASCARDVVSFEEFYAEHHRSAVRQAARLTSAAQAEDVAAEAFLRLYDKWSAVDDPRAYLARTIRHVVIDQARRQSTADRYVASELVEEYGGRLLDDEVTTRSELANALAGLAPQQRATLVLRYWCDLPVAEVAALVGVSTGTVKSNASRGLAALRRSVPCCPSAA